MSAPLTAQVIDLIRHCLRHRLRTPDIDAGTTLAELQADPIDVINISCAVEEAFALEFPDAEIEGWGSVADVAASVALHLAVPV